MIIKHKFIPDLNLIGKRITLIATGSRRAGLINVVSTVEALAIKDAPVRTSNLANSGTSDVNEDGTIGIVKFTARYAGYVHEGTGLYGPHKTKIVPRSGENIRGRSRDAQGYLRDRGGRFASESGKKALWWPGAKHPVRSVKGQKPNRFLIRAAQDTDIPQTFIDGAEKYIRRQR